MKAAHTMLVAGASLVLSAGLTFAAAPNAKAEHPHPGACAANALNLTETQKAQIKPIREKYRSQFQSLRTGKLDRATMRARVRELRDKMRAEIAPLLTDAQRAKTDQWQKLHGQRAGHGRRQHGMMGRSAQRLQLTPAQREQVRAIMAQHRAEFRALRQEAKAAGADRQQIQARRKALHEQLVAQIRPILTTEQQSKLDTMRQHGGKRHAG